MPRLEVDLVKAGKWMRHEVWHEVNLRSIADSVVPVIDAGLADFVDPEFQVASDIRLLPCYGHSSGMLLVEISGGSKGIIAGGDPLHHPLQVLDPNVNTGFCEKPDEAAASRHAFLARCADEGWAIAPTHFLVPRVTKVRYPAVQSAALQESGNGTKRTFQPRSAMSAFGGKADIDQTFRNVRF